MRSGYSPLSRRGRTDGPLGHEQRADPDDFPRRAAGRRGFYCANRRPTDPRIGKLYPANARERLFARVPAVAARDYVYAPMACGRRGDPACGRRRRHRCARQLPGHRDALGDAGTRGGRHAAARSAARRDARVGDDDRPAAGPRQPRARQARGFRRARREPAGRRRNTLRIDAVVKDGRRYAASRADSAARSP